MIKRIFLTAILWIAASAVVISLTSNPVLGATSLTHQLSNSSKVYDIASKIAYYEDKTSELTLNDIIELNNSSAFTYSEGSAPSFKSTDSAYWFHSSVENNSDEQITWIARINYPLLDNINFHTVRPNNRTVIKTGDLTHFDSRPIDHQYYLFPITFKPKETLDIYIHVISSGAITVPIQLYQAKDIIEISNTHSLLQGLHYGTLLILSIYNCFLFASTRSRSYLYNALYMLSLGLFMFSMSGLSFQYLWPNNPELANTAIPVSLGLVILSIALFTRSFLYTSPNQVNTLKAINIITVLGLIIICSGVLLPYYIAVKLGTALGIIATVIVYIIGVTRMAEHYKPAKQFVLAWTIFLTGAVTYALATFGFIPGQFIQEYIIRVATGAQVIFINIALATRVRVLNRQLLDAESYAKESLENQVEDRTLQLKQAMEKLSELNSALKNISTTDELTGIANRRSFNETFDDSIKLANREKQPLSLLLIDIDHFKLVNDKYGHLVGDECLKHLTKIIGGCLNRPGDLLARFGGEEFAAILPNTSAQGAKIIANHIISSVRGSSFTTAEYQLPLTVSIGIATQEADNLKETSLIEHADKALYCAKNDGRNTCKVFRQSAISV